jgi:ABC-type microcin C transport system duplicated ATPase subunit YejF
MMHLQFKKLIVCDLITAAKDRAVNGKRIQKGRPSQTSSQLSYLEIKHTIKLSNKCILL